MLARMNFASALAAQPALQAGRRGAPAARRALPKSLLAYVLEAMPRRAARRGRSQRAANYLRATGPWTGSDAQLQAKVPGLVHLMAGTPEYQFV